MATKVLPPIVKQLRKLSRDWFNPGSPEHETIESVVRELIDSKWEGDWLRRENRDLEARLSKISATVEPWS